MGNPEQGEGQVNFLEVERVHTAQGSFSIYQVNARRLEHIEATIVKFRESGTMLGTSASFDTRIAKPFFRHKVLEYEGTEGLPTVIYLTGPTQLRTNS